MLPSVTRRLVAVLFATLNLSNAFPLSEPHISRNGILPSYPLSRRATQQDYVTYAIAASNQMQTWYNAATGLWSGDWWNSANVLTTLADFAEHFPSDIDHITNQVFPTTLAQAPGALGFTGFINGFYDDELWWTLAWIKVYDVTGDSQYLNMAAQIFEDPKNEFDNLPSTCGGLWWDKAHSGTNAVESALYLTAAAKLANRLPSTPSGGYYYNEAIKMYDWFMASGLINSNNLINDNLNAACVNDLTTPEFTYNQGIILSGLTELAWAAPADQAASMNDLANTLALAGIAHFTDSNGILHEACEPNCDSDSQQFKGIFGRNIQFMVNRANDMPDSARTTYINFLKVNADAIWSDDQVNNQLGLVWTGASGTKTTIQTQSSALDVIVGAACVS